MKFSATTCSRPALQFCARLLDWAGTTYGKLVLALVVVLTVSSLGFYSLEIKPRDLEGGLLGAVYWTMVTLTTVGYGDLVPTSVPGRLLSMLVMLSGIGLLSTITGNLASLLVERNAQKRKGLLKVNLTGHIVILGWNAHALGLIRTLVTAKCLAGAGVVLVNELPQETRDELAFKLQHTLRLDTDKRLHFVFGSPSQESVVSRASPRSARTVYILSQEARDPRESDQQSLYTALTVRALAPKVPIYSEAALPENRMHLRRAGVNEAVVRGELTSQMLGLMGSTPSVWPFFQRLLGLEGQGNLEYRLLTQEEKKMTWRQLLDASRATDGALPLALCRESHALSLQDMLDEGSALDRFILELFTASGQETQLGSQGPTVLLNPSDSHPLAGHDSILFLKGAEGGAA